MFAESSSSSSKASKHWASIFFLGLTIASVKLTRRWRDRSGDVDRSEVLKVVERPRYIAQSLMDHSQYCYEALQTPSTYLSNAVQALSTKSRNSCSRLVRFTVLWSKSSPMSRAILNAMPVQ